MKAKNRLIRLQEELYRDCVEFKEKEGTLVKSNKFDSLLELSTRLNKILKAKLDFDSLLYRLPQEEVEEYYTWEASHKDEVQLIYATI